MCVLGGLGIAFGKFAETDSLVDSGWNFKAPAVTTTGNVTVGGQVVGNKGGSWIKGRENASIKNTQNASGTFNVVASQKTKEGTWNIGSLGSDNKLYFSYDTDTNYNGNNNQSTRITLNPTAGILATLQAVYPVGSIYISTSSTNPNTVFGFGTWEALKNRFLVGAGDTYAVNATGGATTHTHTLSASGHADISYIWTGSRNRLVMKTTSYSFTGNRYTDNDVSFVDGSQSSTTATPLSGKTDSGSTMPPYLAVYMWKRTA